MEKDSQLIEFNRVITKNYEVYRKKFQDYCFKIRVNFSEDTLNETYLKVVEKINKDGIEAKTEQEFLNYFFKSFKNNILQENMKISKHNDLNLNVEDFDFYEDEDEENEKSYSQLAKIILEQAVKENFDAVDYAIFRLKYLLTINGKTLTFKEIKKITGIKDTRARLVKMNRYLRENYSKEKLKEIIRENRVFDTK